MCFSASFLLSLSLLLLSLPSPSLSSPSWYVYDVDESSLGIDTNDNSTDIFDTNDNSTDVYDTNNDTNWDTDSDSVGDTDWDNSTDIWDTNVDDCDAPCEPGSYHEESDPYSQCWPCPSGVCHTGYQCDLCPSGTFSSSPNASSCVPCPENNVAPVGSSGCTSCAIGSGPSPDNSSCVACDNGYYNDDNKDGRCIPCPAGKQSFDGISCVACPAGTYNADPASPCLNCPAGTYSDSRGATSPDTCQTCPPGYYCPDERTTFPSTCPKNYKCGGGTIDPQKCSFLTHSQDGSSTCKESALFYVMIFILVAICAGAGVAVYVFWNKKSAPGQDERQGLIPRPTGPIYEGW